MITRVLHTPRPLLCLLGALAIAVLWIAPSGAIGASSQGSSNGGQSSRSSGSAGSGAAKSGSSANGGGAESSSGGAAKAGGSASSAGGEAAGGSAGGGLEGAGTSGITAERAPRGTTETSGGPLGSSMIVFGLGGAAAILAAIAAFIVRDARKNAPVPEGFLENSSTISAENARKRRAKAKAARQQRKRNRNRR